MKTSFIIRKEEDRECLASDRRRNSGNRLCGAHLVVVELKRTIDRLRSETDRLRSENEQLSNQLKDAVEQLAVLNKEPTSKRFSKLVDLLVSAGIPGLIFLGAVAASGFYGAAAITATLAALGARGGCSVESAF